MFLDTTLEQKPNICSAIYATQDLFHDNKVI